MKLIWLLDWREWEVETKTFDWFDTNMRVSSLQEIYPPKICEFAYVTDGACDMWDIQQTELHMLKVRTTSNLNVVPPRLEDVTSLHTCRIKHATLCRPAGAGLELVSRDANLVAEALRSG